MKTTLQSFFNAKAIPAFVIYATLLFCSVTAFGQQTTIFSDDFNRGSAAELTSGGTPSVTYTNTKVGTTTILTTLTASTDYRLQIATVASTTAGALAGRSFTMAPIPVNASYKTTLKNNTGLVTWSFNMRQNRGSGSTTTLSGFDPAQWGLATIIACDNAIPTDATAKGYAVVMGGVGTKNTYDLVSFAGGLTATANLTTIIPGVTLTSFKDVVSIKVTFDPVSKKWNMYQKDEGTVYSDPSAISVAAIGEVLDPTGTGHVDIALANFGFFYNHNTFSSAQVAAFDNYKVTVGSVAASTYYLAANSDCSVLGNWGTNTDGSGANPANFALPNTTFNIFNTGATIGSDWTVNGSASKVVLGDGINANSLTISATAFLDGKIDLAVSASLTISHVTKFPALNIISPSSSVIYNGILDQVVQGTAYGNLTINTTGTATSTGVMTVSGALTIANGATLNMGTNKLLAVGSVGGTGSLKTTYSSSTAAALPVDITWPFSIFYGTASAVQTVVPGSYTNLDITGGGTRNLLGAVISVSGTLQADGVTYTSGTSVIDFNGTLAQTIGNDFPGFAMKISNSSASGVSLTASDKILDTTNLELAGTLSSGGVNETFGILTVTNNAVLNLGPGSHSIAFANSSADFWDPTKTLTIKGWTGTAGATGSNGKVFVGTNATGLTPSQLSQIKFEGYTGATILDTGEVVPTASLGTTKQDFVNFKYYPNPVVESITLSHTAPITKLAVYNLLGKKVLTSNPNTASTKLDMSGLSPSTYFIEVTSEGKKGTVKVIKN